MQAAAYRLAANESQQALIQPPAVHLVRARFASIAPPRARRELAGLRLRAPGSSAVDLVDPEGLRRRIPCDETYRRLFCDEAEVAEWHTIEAIAEGLELAMGAMLVRGDVSDRVYLFDGERKRQVRDRAAFHKYGFSADRVRVIRQALVDSMRAAGDWY